MPVDLTARLLARSGIPPLVLAGIKGAPTQKAVEIATAALQAQRYVVAITGADSPNRERRLAKIALELGHAASKSIRWVPPANTPNAWQDGWPNTGVLVIPSLEALSKTQQQSLAAAIRTRIPHGFYTLLGCEMPQALAQCLGAEVFAYIKHTLITHNVKADQPVDLSL